MKKSDMNRAFGCLMVVVLSLLPLWSQARNAVPSKANAAWVQTFEPEQQDESQEYEVKGVIPLDDNRHLGNLSTKKFNKVVADELFMQLDDMLKVPGTTLTHLTLAGYGAPVGNFNANEARSTARAIDLKSYLVSLQGLPTGGIDISWVAEDWDGIMKALKTSDYRLKQAAIDIIRNVDIAAGREEQVMMLDGGHLYTRLQQTVFPALNRLEFAATLSRSGAFAPDEVTHSVKLLDMYHTAMTFEKGSTDYNDLLDLSARLYPGNAVACINGAAVALMQGNLEKAASLLAGFETDPRAFCNYGVLYLLKGDKDKAEIYLMMAAANNVKEAATVLGLFNIKEL